MAIPSGSGTEVLKVRYSAGVTNTEYVVMYGNVDHIQTILSVTICETTGNPEIFDMYVDDYDSATGPKDYEILSDTPLGANETFVWNDRLVLPGGDRLCIALASPGNVDVVVSYIDQDWT